MTSGRYDWTAGSMRGRWRIYDVQVIALGPLTNDAGRQIDIFHGDTSPALLRSRNPWASFVVTTVLAKSEVRKNHVVRRYRFSQDHGISLNSLSERRKFPLRISDWLCTLLGREIRRDVWALREAHPWSDSLILAGGLVFRESPSRVGQTLTLSGSKHSTLSVFLFYKVVKRRGGG